MVLPQILCTTLLLLAALSAASGRQLRAETGAPAGAPPAPGEVNVLEYTLPYELPMPGAPAPLQLNATFYVYLPPPDYDYGADGRRGLRPLLFLLHGFNVAPESYSALLGELTARGYVVVAPDFVQALNIPIPGMPRPGCLAAYHMAPPGLLNTFLDALDEAPVDFMNYEVDPDSLVLLGHSQGGGGAVMALAGACGGQPTMMTALACGGYRAVNATIEGVITWEGYAQGPVVLPPGMFALFVAGAFDNATLAAAQNTTGGTCVSYLQLNGTDHYGITNYDAVDAAHDGQVLPCARPSSHDPPGWTTNPEDKASGIELFAELVDAAVRGDTVGPGADVESDPRVLERRSWGACTG